MFIPLVQLFSPLFQQNFRRKMQLSGRNLHSVQEARKLFVNLSKHKPMEPEFLAGQTFPLIPT
jgi:hypothetical protein